MKCFAWIESAVQALTNDSKGGQREDEQKEATPHNTHREDEVKVEQSKVPPVVPLPILPAATESVPQDNLVDISNDPESARTVIPAPAKTTIRPVSTENLPIKSSSKASGKSYGAMASSKEPLHDASLAFDYNPAVLAYVSSGRVENPRSLRRRNMSSTSTIFKNSPLAPITIIVTTPEENSQPLTATPEAESYNPFNAIRAHRRQSASLPSSRRGSLSSPNNLLIPDSNRLRPPTEQQINASKLRKAREFREIRKFLITFMNAKGDQFPKKLRCRMMEMYCITEADLAPETVAKFTDEVRDEGVALEQLGISEGEGTDLDDLRILQMAFMSQIPMVTPTKEQAAVDDLPPLRPRKQSLIGRRAEARKEKSDDDGTLSWLGPLVTSTPLAAPPLDSPPPKPFTGEHKLIRAASVPNMHRVQEESDVPPLPSIPAAYTNAVAPVKRGRNSTLSGGTPNGVVSVDAKLRIIEQQTRTKRGNILSSTFGTIRGAIAASKNAKAAEKRRLLKDAIL